MATGGKFILGQLNKANEQTTLKRTTGGPALTLTTKSSANAPLVTNGRGKVGNLNADLVDGYDSSALLTTPWVFTRNITTPVDGFDLVASVPVGTYLVSYSAYVQASPPTSLGFFDCFVTQQNGLVRRYVGEDDTDNQMSTGAASGSGLVTKSVSTGTITLTCNSSSVPFTSFTSEPGTEPVQLVLTPVNGATSGSAQYLPNARTVH